ncbi:hypothetical protein Kpol_1043p57 [Vanderwaltozyma polyspora DSM 70294]|uniref:Uncharacterized protein n=1 Tax=Vanderwaltozyma polyspora (strain ATCC 22028 / DSM 70294 / BCRC 21397 / CBS 2163 / NBRC 10782 / NRRL Y-8283 / UCD 57-17) TaxID=436907 RepID=A7TIS5_VANPO|nr:uncharacterized protein Kpol_1043p57 [Vanderwaltozyma polyspora DSM 70294]EDO17867.1 hypothetical protein Kpol_1043p57 [Vanderwaltozyma polyspora DSM 70294]
MNIYQTISSVKRDLNIVFTKFKTRFRVNVIVAILTVILFIIIFIIISVQSNHIDDQITIQEVVKYLISDFDILRYDKNISLPGNITREQTPNDFKIKALTNIIKEKLKKDVYKGFKACLEKETIHYSGFNSIQTLTFFCIINNENYKGNKKLLPIIHRYFISEQNINLMIIILSLTVFREQLTSLFYFDQPTLPFESKIQEKPTSTPAYKMKETEYPPTVFTDLKIHKTERIQENVSVLYDSTETINDVTSDSTARLIDDMYDNNSDEDNELPSKPENNREFKLKKLNLIRKHLKIFDIGSTAKKNPSKLNSVVLARANKFRSRFTSRHSTSEFVKRRVESILEREQNVLQKGGIKDCDSIRSFIDLHDYNNQQNSLVISNKKSDSSNDVVTDSVTNLTKQNSESENSSISSFEMLSDSKSLRHLKIGPDTLQLDFNLTAAEERNRWASYIKNLEESNDTSYENLSKNQEFNKQLFQIYRDRIKLYDVGGKPLRRVMIPGIGWVSHYKAQELMGGPSK